MLENPLQIFHGFHITHQTHANSGIEKAQETKGGKDKFPSFFFGKFGQKIQNDSLEALNVANIYGHKEYDPYSK